MSRFFIVSAMFVAVGLFTNNLFAKDKYEGSRYSEVWEQVASDPYTELPQMKVTFASLFEGFKSKIKIEANRTLSDRSDLLPHFKKLAHPNGICLTGQWEITEDNPYGGYFKQGSQALIIARASTAMTNTKRGDYRAFGFAGKLFPTTEADHSEKLETANFFLVDDLGGTLAKRYADVEMTNEPAVSKTTAALKKLAYAVTLALSFRNADSNPGIRQVYEISELGEADTSQVKTPKWMMVRALGDNKLSLIDFRNELSATVEKGTLEFGIFVASKSDTKGNKNWSQIGKITVDETVTSDSCDHRLHFHHPKWRTNLNH